ncbi:hypothetical protein PR048_003813 [Dryococelus australis]|uniref:Uncharacterized protein n=1 Tax=Dryococelus australis TaxID=614101 RepID=A0ABQ9IP46_9NEOP|nr:hypothetical protein PR048_003813 [Dryococelus australis]
MIVSEHGNVMCRGANPRPGHLEAALLVLLGELRGQGSDAARALGFVEELVVFSECSRAGNTAFSSCLGARPPPHFRPVDVHPRFHVAAVSAPAAPRDYPRESC